MISPAPARSPRFDCFYVYPTVSRELALNADLRVQSSEVDTAIAQAAPFSRVCRVFAPMYRQVTLAALALHPSLDVPAAYGLIAYDSLLAGFESYMADFNDGRPIVFIGHSQGAVILIRLLSRLVDNDPDVAQPTPPRHHPGRRRRGPRRLSRRRQLLAHPGLLAGGRGRLRHRLLELPEPAGRLGAVRATRTGGGAAIGTDGQKGPPGPVREPGGAAGGAAGLDPYFPSEGAVPTPWVEFPGLYEARCETDGGASWLQVTKATGSYDKRPVVSDDDGPDWGYHTYDVNLALGNLVGDVASAESTWAAAHPKAH